MRREPGEAGRFTLGLVCPLGRGEGWKKGWGRRSPTLQGCSKETGAKSQSSLQAGSKESGTCQEWAYHSTPATLRCWLEAAHGKHGLWSDTVDSEHGRWAVRLPAAGQRSGMFSRPPQLQTLRQNRSASMRQELQGATALRWPSANEGWLTGSC